jgi:hypothetical protein
MQDSKTNKTEDAKCPLTGEDAIRIMHAHSNEYRTNLLGDLTYTFKAEMAIENMSEEEKEIILDKCLMEKPALVDEDYLSKTLGEIFG